MEQEKDMDADRKLPCGPEKDIGYYIKRINDKLKAGFDAYLCDVDLTSSQARVIEYVYWNGGMVTQKEIEVFLDVAHPTVDRKSTRLNSSHNVISRMPSSA